MEPLEIGIATIEYALAGFVMEASFRPTVSVELNPAFFEQLQSIEPNSNREILQRNSEMALAGWFSKMNEIELSDREQYKITTEVIDCESHPNGLVKKCVIKYFFTKI